MATEHDAEMRTDVNALLEWVAGGESEGAHAARVLTVAFVGALLTVAPAVVVWVVFG